MTEKYRFIFICKINDRMIGHEMNEVSIINKKKSRQP